MKEMKSVGKRRIFNRTGMLMTYILLILFSILDKTFETDSSTSIKESTHTYTTTLVSVVGCYYFFALTMVADVLPLQSVGSQI